MNNRMNHTAKPLRTALSLLLCSLLCCLCALPAFATDAGTAQNLSYITDTASILSADEVASLEKTAEDIAARYGCGVYIVTVDDYTNYTDSGSVAACAEEIWNYYSLGYGEGKDGIMLLLSMDDRDYDLTAHGDIGNTTFTDYGKEFLADYFLGNFSQNDWYTGFENYLAGCSSMLASAAAGTPVDDYNAVPPPEPPPMWAGFVASLLIGLIIALIVCMIIRGSMKSVHQQTQAGNYITQNGVNFTCRQDFFTHSTEVRVYDPPQKSNNGGGGGTTINSGGFSHSSGKF